MIREEIKGIPVSNGIGIGTIYVLEQSNREPDQSIIEDLEIQAEIKRLEVAIEHTKIELYDLKDDFKDTLNAKDVDIFEAYKMILHDQSFIQEMIDLITECNYHADNAVDICFNNYMDALLRSGNEYMRERVYDFKDIKSRIIRNLFGENKIGLDKIYHKNIVVVRQLTPSLAAALGKKKIMGVAAFEGAAYLSHAAIILRGLGIPAVNNIDFEKVAKYSGSFAIIEGTEGLLLVNPGKVEGESYRHTYKIGLQKYKKMFREFLKRKDLPAVTTDGHKIRISTNVGSYEETEESSEKFIEGIGLVRTELLFIKNEKMPNEKEQFAVYSKIVKKMARRPVVIRTLDIGEDKNLGDVDLKTNSSLATLRGIRYMLAQKDQFIKQLRAIALSNEMGNVGIVFPMVYNFQDVVQAKEMLERAYTTLSEEKKPYKRLPVGVMIETRESVDLLEQILSEVDFINIGTNDMLHEFLGTDRKKSGKEETGYLHPDFLKMIKRCIQKADEMGVQVRVCGELASDVSTTALLIGMGAKELSLTPNKAAKIAALIRKISLEESKQIAALSLACKSIDDVKQILSGYR